MQLVKQIDDFLFAKFFQRATDWLVEKRDTSNYALASVCYATFVLCSLGWYVSLGVLPPPFIVVVSVGMWFVMDRICRARHERWKTAHVPFAEPTRKHYFLRVISIMLVTWFQYDYLMLYLEGLYGLVPYTIGVMRDAGLVGTMYFFACTPKPRKPQEKEEEVPAGYAPQAS